MESSLDYEWISFNQTAEQKRQTNDEEEGNSNWQPASHQDD